ncbi:MAG: hypothetical protein Q8934_10905 [Bacillota bacterium]|nr:hypothetical protein [Bacillota bacterium]
MSIIKGTGAQIKYGIDLELEQLTIELVGGFKTPNYKREKPLAVWKNKVGLDWLINQNEQSGAIGNLASKEEVFLHIRYQVRAFMVSGGNAKGSKENITEEWAMAYELWVNRGMTLTSIGEMLNVSRQTITSWLIKFFTLIDLKLTVGVRVKSQILDHFIHPAILQLRVAMERKRVWKRAQRKMVKVNDAERGLAVTVFHWTSRFGRVEQPLEPLRDKQLPIPRN